MPKNKLPKIRSKPIGWIVVDMFNFHCPVFTSDEARVAFSKKKDIPFEAYNEPSYGHVCRSIDDDGSYYFSMVLTPEASIGTWAHESSHLTDFIFERFSIPTGVKNTEVRAYMIGCMVDQIAEFMAKESLRLNQGQAAEASPSPIPLH